MTLEEPPAPPTIPDYELLRLVGRGSYGDVWLARGVTGLFRAIKIVWRARFADAQPFEREFRGLKEFAAISLLEARQLALLHVGRNEAAGFFYYVMELADDAVTGREIDPAHYVPLTLREIRQRRGRLPAAEVVTLGAELARALAGLHTRSLVHRDIKPSNVILVGGAPKLADIGLVAAASEAMTFVGTEGYVPPEGPGAPSADVFSLGKLLYELATGLDRHDYPRLPANFSELPDRKDLLELNEVLIRACEPLAAKRHSDATALLDDLLLLQAGKSVRRLRAAERRLARALRVAAVLAIVAAFAASGAWIERALRRKAEIALADLARQTFYSASLGRAQRALEIGAFGTARKILEGVNPQLGEADLRHFEWFALWNEAQGDQAEILRESGPSGDSVHVSPDGKLLATRQAGQTAVIWDVASRKSVRTISGVERLAGFSPDGAWLLGTNAAQLLQRWSVADGKPEPPLTSSPHQIIGTVDNGGIVSFELQYSSRGDSTGDERPVASIIGVQSRDAANRLVHAHTIPADHEMKAWENRSASSVSPDGRLLAMSVFVRNDGQNQWRLLCYDVATLNLLWKKDYTSEVNVTAFSTDGNDLAVGFAGTDEVEVWDTTKREVRWRGFVEANVIRTMAFSADNRLLAVGGRDQTIHIVTADAGKPVNRLRGQNGAINGLAWARTGTTLYSSGDGGDLRRWPDATVSSQLRTVMLEPARRKFRYVCLSDDGNRFAAVHGPNRIAVGAIHVGEAPELVTFPAGVPLAFDHGGEELLTIDPQGMVNRWQIEAPNEPKHELQIPMEKSARIICASLSKDGRRLVSKDSYGDIQFWDFPERRLIGRVHTKNGVTGTSALSPTGRWAMTWSNSLALQLWNVDRATKIAEWKHDSNSVRVAFANHRSWLAISFIDGSMEIRDLKTLGVVQRWKTDSSRLEAVTFSEDDLRLFCGGANGTVHIYDTAEWKEVTTLQLVLAHESGDPTVTGLAMNAQGTALAAYRQDGMLRAWTSRR